MYSGENRSAVPPRGDALDAGGARRLDFEVLIGEHTQPGGARDIEQFAGAQQEIGVPRATEAFVPRGEGLADQHPAGRERRGQRREQRTVEVVGDDDAGEARVAERPAGAGFEVEPRTDRRGEACAASVARATGSRSTAVTA